MEKRKFSNGGIYTADMGQPPQDIDGASAPMKKTVPKKPEPEKPRKPVAPKPPQAIPRKLDSVPDESKTFKQGGATMMKRPSPKDMMAAAAMRRSMAPAGMASRPGMGMKEGGMPMKDGKPAFMMKKKMMGGGMTGYAKGGGIESKGKTKGTVVKMASGGNVSSRADGIAQRGKTKTTMC